MKRLRHKYGEQTKGSKMLSNCCYKDCQQIDDSNIQKSDGRWMGGVGRELGSMAFCKKIIQFGLCGLP